jgi:hypothetical protein
LCGEAGEIEAGVVPVVFRNIFQSRREIGSGCYFRIETFDENEGAFSGFKRAFGRFPKSISGPFERGRKSGYRDTGERRYKACV